jgi:hypothetical protein
MALTQAEKSEWLYKITEQVEVLRSRLLSAEPGLINSLKKEATVEAHERLGVTSVLQQMEELGLTWQAQKKEYESECAKLEDRCAWMRDSIDKLCKSLNSEIDGEREKKQGLYEAREKSLQVLRSDGNDLYASLDELLAVESNEGHYHASGSFVPRSEHARELTIYTSAVAAELTHNHPIGRLSTVLDSATFEFSSAMRMVTTTKQAHIVWKDVQQFLAEFEEQLDESAQTETSSAGAGTAREESRAGATAHG